MTGWITVDIGGTKLAAAAWDGNRLSARSQIPTGSQDGAERIIHRLLQLLSDTADKAGIGTLLGIGIACPGPLSAKDGIVIRAPMLGWENVPIVQIVQERFGCPVLLENDANAAALGEYVFGAGKGVSSMAYITVSTGVGCGIVHNGKIWEGAHESAGELGHIVLYRGGRKCPCGRRGCLERYASGTAIGQEASRVLRARGICSAITAQDAARLAKQGDQEMLSVFRKTGQYLGRGIAALLQLTDPERVVIGGSVAKSFDLISEGIQESVWKESYWGRDENWLVKAQLEGDSGLLGAAVLISNMEGGK